METQPPNPFPPSIRCTHCGLLAVAVDLQAPYPTARYACGTTSLMLYNDLHIDVDDAQARARWLEHWKRRLRRHGIEDHALALDPFRPDEAQAALQAKIDEWESGKAPSRKARNDGGQAKLAVRA